MIKKANKSGRLRTPWSLWRRRKITSLSVIKAMKVMVKDKVSLSKIGKYFDVNCQTVKYWVNNNYKQQIQERIRRNNTLEYARNPKAVRRRSKKAAQKYRHILPDIEGHYAKGLPVEA